MASPTNSSGKLRVAGGTGNQTFNAPFTFAASRQAVLTLAGYADGTAITGITIGGTAATKRAESSGPDYAAIWDVLGGGVAGGTDNIVVAVAPGTPNVYLSLAVEEWTAGTLSYDTGTASSSSVANTNAPSIATAGALSTASSIVYSALNMYGINGTCVPTQPTGWTSSFGESDGTTYEMGMGCWHEETSTGIKTALYSLSANNDTQLAIAGYILSAGGGGGSGKPWSHYARMMGN
jgi:hypothetical protein